MFLEFPGRMRTGCVCRGEGACQEPDMRTGSLCALPTALGISAWPGAGRALLEWLRDAG